MKWYDYAIPGSLIACMTLFICLGLGYAIYDSFHPELLRSVVRFQGEVKKCKVEFPKQADGKMSFWYGVVNLTDCEDHRDIAGAVNVEIIEKAKRGCP